jgi:limonene-1,2-epoxide hydrolase
MTTQNTSEENKQIVRAFIETAFNQHQADRAADYLTPDMKWHGGTLGTVEGREQVAGKIAEEWAADDLLAFVYGVGAYTPPWLSQQS